MYSLLHFSLNRDTAVFYSFSLSIFLISSSVCTLCSNRSSSRALTFMLIPPYLSSRRLLTSWAECQLCHVAALHSGTWSLTFAVSSTSILAFPLIWQWTLLKIGEWDKKFLLICFYEQTLKPDCLRLVKYLLFKTILLHLQCSLVTFV